MKIEYSTRRYFLSTKYVWLLFILAIYCSFACEFESLQIPALRILDSNEKIDKFNKIVESISLSYIAGTIFFILSDSIPYLRRKKVAISKIQSSVDAVMEDITRCFSVLDMNNSKEWTGIMAYEKLSGYEYCADNPIYFEPECYALNELKSAMSSIADGIDYILSQELYLDNSIYKEINSLKLNHTFFIFRDAMDKDKVGFEPKEFIEGIDSIIDIYKHLNGELC